MHRSHKIVAADKVVGTKNNMNSKASHRKNGEIIVRKDSFLENTAAEHLILGLGEFDMTAQVIFRGAC